MRLLFLADTHLGFDLPFKPRVERRRRGPDFFRTFEMALEPALKGEVDAVIHGGDILFRSKVPPQLVRMAFETLLDVAEKGIPVYLVPGNHERGSIPFRLFATHKNVHIFLRPRTFYLDRGGVTLGLSGFPYIKENIRERFLDVLEETGWRNRRVDISLLCIHHCVEGASIRMGNKMHIFRSNPDVIKISQFPTGFAGVLSGHIHRFQLLTRDLQGNSVGVRVFYPGSTERTSFAEKGEQKGYLILDVEAGGNNGSGLIKSWVFHELPARPMHVPEVHAGSMSGEEMRGWIKKNLDELPEESVVKLNIHGKLSPGALEVLRAEAMRSLVPPGMNVTVSLMDMNLKAF
jgi:exonuclease SbcD